jgi:hypothetical protein
MKEMLTVGVGFKMFSLQVLDEYWLISSRASSTGGVRTSAGYIDLKPLVVKTSRLSKITTTTTILHLHLKPGTGYNNVESSRALGSRSGLPSPQKSDPGRGSFRTVHGAHCMTINDRSDLEMAWIIALGIHSHLSLPLINHFIVIMETGSAG